MKPEVMRALAAAGATIEMITAAVEAEQLIEQEKLVEKRAKAAERQRNKRERDALSRNVTVTERDTTLHGVTERDDTLSPPSSPKKVSPSKPLQKITPPTSSIPSARSLADDWPEDFGDLVWKAYPRKTEKLSAMRKLAQIRKSGVVTFADLLAGVQRYAASVAKTEMQFIKQLTAWLNAGRWTDEAAALVRSTGPPRNGAQGFESLFQQPETTPDDLAPRSEFDIDLTANRPG